MEEEYRLIYKVCSSQSEANRYLKDIKGKARNPQVVFSTKSGAWVVEICRATERSRIEDAFMYFRKQGIKANIQKINGA